MLSPLQLLEFRRDNVSDEDLSNFRKDKNIFHLEKAMQ